MDRDGGSGAHVFGMVGPGIACGYVRYFGSFEVDRRVSGAVEVRWEQRGQKEGKAASCWGPVPAPKRCRTRLRIRLLRERKLTVLARACAWMNPPQRGYRAGGRGTNGAGAAESLEQKRKAGGQQMSGPPAGRAAT